MLFFFFSSRRRHTRYWRDWSSDVCSSDLLGWMDYLSPTSWAMKGFDIVLGFDPIGWLQEKFAGDWEALASMHPVLDNTATALHDLALNVQSGATTLHPLWQGNAGDTAYRYLDRKSVV